MLFRSVCSLKIEGRLKTPEYVANITRHYRQAIDSAVAGKPVSFIPRDVEEMELSFSRGFSPGWLQGDDHKMLVPGQSSSKRGVLLGKVVVVRRGRVVVDLVGSVKRGDGVSFDSGQAADDEQGGRVYEVFQQARSITEPVSTGRVELAFGHDSIDLDSLRPGQAIWKTDDPELTARLRKSFTSHDPQRRLPTIVAAHAAVGEPLRLKIEVAGRRIDIESDEVAAEATQHPLTAETLEKQLGRLGGTPFELHQLTTEIVGRPMFPFSVLGKLRHEMVRQLEAALAKTPVRKIAHEDVLAGLRGVVRQTISEPRTGWKPILRVLCRSLPQLETLLGAGERDLYVDFADIRQYREAVSLAHSQSARIYLVTPRIQKPGEIGIFQALTRHDLYPETLPS